MADLLFAQAPIAGSPTPLVFGDDAASNPVRDPVLVDASIALGSINVQASMGWDRRVTNWLDYRTQTAHQVAQSAQIGRITPFGRSLSRRNIPNLGFGLAALQAVSPRAASSTAIYIEQPGAIPWALAQGFGVASAVAHQACTPIAISAVALWQLANSSIATNANPRVQLQTGIFKSIERRLIGQQAGVAGVQLTAIAGASWYFAGVSSSHMPWGTGGAAQRGRSVRPPVPPPPCVNPATPHLVFMCPPLAAPALVFGTTVCDGVLAPDGASFFILPARFYMTTHTIIAHRLPDGLELPIYGASVSADSGSFCWQLSATGPASLLTLLEPVGGLPTQIRVTLDGLPFVFVVDAITRTHAFGKTGVSISGRSTTSLVGAPYLRAISRTNSMPITAQQMALEALSGTGVDLDWGIGAGALANGGLVDWLLPSNAFSHVGTPLDAVQAIVQAAGGTVQSHPSAPTLIARHPYGQRIGDVSGAPWDWSAGAPDVALAVDALITESLERRDGADINAVYVSGTTQGVLAQVKRTGSAGDKLAALVTDPLLTHTDAARQRGLAILGAAGQQYNVRVDLPVLTGANQPGILSVGQLVQVNANTPWRGRVRAISVNAQLPTIRQSVTLERHL